jgi:uncharacterized protein YndB with AHSA1/START domain
VSSCRRHGLIEAPLQVVWDLVADPARYPEWAGGVIDVTGLATLEQGATFRQKSRTPLGPHTTTFLVEDLDDMREIRLRCLASGYYSHWLLTEAMGDTFTEVEIGMEPIHVGNRAFDAVLGRSWYRRLVDESLTQLAEVARGYSSASGAPETRPALQSG